jgi:hypothetical protein
MSDKSEVCSISGISESRTKCDTWSSASDPSCIDDTLLPPTWEPKKRLGVPNREKNSEMCF